MTDEQIVKAMAQRAYTQQPDGTWLREPKRQAAVLCSTCLERTVMRHE
jgi:hypothetical protein